MHILTAFVFFNHVPKRPHGNVGRRQKDIEFTFRYILQQIFYKNKTLQSSTIHIGFHIDLWPKFDDLYSPFSTGFIQKLIMWSSPFFAQFRVQATPHRPFHGSQAFASLAQTRLVLLMSTTLQSWGRVISLTQTSFAGTLGFRRSFLSIM